jgi:hypothetical protein
MPPVRRASLAVLILLVSLAAAAPAFAQNTQSSSSTPGARSGDGGVGIGALGMITRGSVRSKGVDDLFDSKTGVGAGLWFGGNKDGLVGFTGELIYLERKLDQSGVEFKTQAIEIPALLRLNIGARSQNGLTVYVVGGPVFTWNLKQTLDGFEVGDNYRSGDIGVMGGLGFEVFRLGIEGRGNWGQRSITIDGDFDESKTFTFELLAKLRFN